MSEAPREFRNVIRSAAVEEAKPVDAYLAEVDAFIDAHNPYRINKVIAAIGAGTASSDIVKRYAKELYYLGLWMTPEFALLVASAPERYGLTMDHSEHYAHWCQNFADEAGFLGDPNNVFMKVEHCHELGITDDELRAYVPMPETIGSVYTLAYYCRSSYEEGLAAFGYARERVAGLSGYGSFVAQHLVRVVRALLDRRVEERDAQGVALLVVVSHSKSLRVVRRSMLRSGLSGLPAETHLCEGR